MVVSQDVELNGFTNFTIAYCRSVWRLLLLILVMALAQSLSAIG
jgi:hypothetical protein